MERIIKDIELHYVNETLLQELTFEQLLEMFLFFILFYFFIFCE